MEYINRELERKFLKMNNVFKALLVTGARQVGKSTMLRHLAENTGRTFVSMDDNRNRELARRDPGLFFQTFKTPILIDEVQKAPELFEHIKMICDETNENGLFWLTGSESKKLLKNAGDSLAGRVCILKMYSLSLKEKIGITSIADIRYTFEDLTEREKLFPAYNLNQIYEHIWKGGMPAMQNFDAEQMNSYYSSYIETYLMRDAVDDNGISDTEGFRRVLSACAAFVGNLVNYSDLAIAGGVSVPTAKSWVKVLQTMGIVFLLDTYSNNELKRLVKTPKLYFCDTGLAAYLSMWTSKDVLMNGAASGHYFENYVVGELLRNTAYGESNVNMTYYRDTNQKEIDVVIEENGVLHPIEIKKATNPERKIVKAFDVLNVSSNELGKGLIICMTDRTFPIDENNYMVPALIL